MNKLNLRLNVTEDERDVIRTAAALAGYRSMAAFCRAAALHAAQEFTAVVRPDQPREVVYRGGKDERE